MHARRWTLPIVVLLAASSVRARGEPLDEALYAELLWQHTRAVPDTVGTRVEYAGLARSPDWKRLIRSLPAVEPAELDSRDQQLAFWINAYNILAIDLIVQHRPVESIRDIGSLFRPVWDREAGRIGGQPYTLGQIEHEILRPMGEPRIHFAIVCASTSCPSLRREPFRAAQLDAQLTEGTRRFLASETKGLRFDGPRSVRLSRIFKWFAEDFEPGGGVIAFVRLHAPEAARERLEGQPDPDIRYFDYDWRLNGLGE